MRATDQPDTGTDAIDRTRIAYTVAETARILGLSTRTIRYLIAKKELQAFKVGAARRVHGTAIEEYVKRRDEAEAAS